MIALDTNVLVRVLVRDDARQTKRVRALVDRALADGAALLVPTVVVCETVWVLESAYGFSRETVAEALRFVLSAEQLQVESHAEVERAVAAYSRGVGDLADHLIRERALGAGAAAVATFDRALLGTAGFVDPDPATWDEGLSLHEATPRYGRRRRVRTTAR